MSKIEKPIGFKIKHIQTEQFAILEDKFKSVEDIGIQTNIQFKVADKEKMVGVFLFIKFIQNNEPFLLIEVSCHFEIAPSSWKTFISSSKTKIIIPKKNLAHLGMITVGTCRGILFAKTEGTEFSKFIIPSLDVVKMIKSDAEFTL